MTLVYPHQYSQLEQKMLTDTQARAQRLEGWYRKDEPVIATEFLLKAWANVVDCWNPLFNDSKYAAESKYRSIIAAPLFGSGVTNPKVSGVHDQIQPEKKSHYRCPLRTCTLESADNPVERTSNERVKW